MSDDRWIIAFSLLIVLNSALVIWMVVGIFHD